MERFGINHLGDWQNIGVKDVEENGIYHLLAVHHNQGGAGLLRRYGNSLPKALAACFPEFPWKDVNFAKPLHEKVTRPFSILFDTVNSLEMKNQEQDSQLKK